MTGDTVPGIWICDACKFVLHKRFIRASDGAVGVDDREIDEPCPNCGTPMQRMTEEEYGDGDLGNEEWQDDDD